MNTNESKTDQSAPRKRSFALSPSRVKDFHQCPLKFRLRVIDAIPEPPSLAALKGTIVHSVLEHLYEAPALQRSESYAQTLLEPLWAKHLEGSPEDLELFSSTSELDQWLLSARDLIAAYFRLENPQYLEPIGREQFVSAQLPSGLAIRGVIDRLDEAANGDLRVIDYKTGKSPSVRFQDEYLFQMKFYAAALQYSQNRLPLRTQLLFLGDQRTLTYDPHPSDVDAVTNSLEHSWSEMKSRNETGEFEPKKGPLCPWCNFQNLCPAFGGQPPEIPESGSEYLLTAQQ